MQVECSGEQGTVTVTLAAPGSYVATSTQPEGGGPAAITVTGPDHEVTWSAEGVPDTQEPSERTEVGPEQAVQ